MGDQPRRHQLAAVEYERWLLMQGRLVRCSNRPCVRRTRMIGGQPGDAWSCDQPDCPKELKAVLDLPAKGGRRK